MAQILKREKRIKLYLAGVGLQLRAAYHRTKAHKLPGKMGEIREDALSAFFNEWLPKKYSAHTNVIPVHKGNYELDKELDLVILDDLDSFRLPLDADGGVHIVAWQDIRIHIEVKSVLKEDEYKKAVGVALACKRFAVETDCPSPPCILFAYDLDPSFDGAFGLDDILFGAESSPFDVIAILGKGTFYAPTHSRLADQVVRGLSGEMAANDGSIEEGQIIREVTYSTGGRPFESVGDESDADVLFALMAFAIHQAAERKDVADELIMAAQRQLHNPIFVQEDQRLNWVKLAEADWSESTTDQRFLRKLQDFRQALPDVWNQLLCHHYGIAIYPANEITYGDNCPPELLGKYLPFYVETSSFAASPEASTVPAGETIEEAAKNIVKHLNLNGLAETELDRPAGEFSHSSK